ncbi:hypothetical protein EVAR_62498_1 [Eumeta japonica]|uniref:Uncharacterized protein n=1 Tax=Eumeta variegata TaxID=151549 RepID=A0A4C1SDD2_EUMVA|nr:hypothetical protein EVAR_62498_1 [Eumeta japonica]
MHSATSASSRAMEPSGLLSEGRSNSHFGIPERELLLRVGELALWIDIREWDMRSRGLKLCFSSYQFKNVRRKLSTIRGCRNLRSHLLTTVLTWLVRAPIAWSICSVVLMSSGILLSGGCRFFERGRHFLPVGDFDSGDRPPAVGRTHFNNTGR